MFWRCWDLVSTKSTPSGKVNLLNFTVPCLRSSSDTSRIPLNFSSDSIESTRDLVYAVLETIRSGMEDARKLWIENGSRLESALMPIWDQAEKKLLRLWEEKSGSFMRFLKRIGETYETIGHIFSGNLDELAKTFKGLEIIGKIKKMYDDYLAWLRELPMQEYLAEAVQMFKDQ